MAAFKVSFVTAVLLALLIFGSQAKPHAPGIWPSVHARGIDLTLQQNCNGRYTPPSGCNVTFTTNTVDFNALNANLSQFCAPRCIDAIISHVRDCPQLLPLDSAEWYYKQYLCGKNGDEFCQVTLLRNPISICSSLIGPTGINCTSATSACLQGLADASSKLGCCTRILFGEGVSSCSGVNVDPACSSTGAIAIGVLPLLLAMISAMF